MDLSKNLGIITVIIGLIFIIFPLFASELVPIIVGLSLIFFGLSTIILGFSIKENQKYTLTSIIIGIIAVIFGILFLFAYDSITFINGAEFYIVGIIMILFGISGIISQMNRVSAFTSILVLIMGIVLIALAIFTNSQPIFVAIIMGIILIIEGISKIISN